MEHSWIFTLLVCIQIVALGVSGSRNIICPGTFVQDKTPISVHRLKVGDIKVVAAMGDSFTAANGAGAIELEDMEKEFKAYSFSGGGHSTYHQGTMNLPNLLSLFNPSLQGFSVAISSDPSKSKANLNVAERFAVSSDMVGQAKKIIDLIKKNSQIDFEKDWKLVTILVGTYDLCNSCANPNKYSAPKYKANIKAALDLLQKNLPRTMVNLIEPFDAYDMMNQMKTNPHCLSKLKYTGCKCEKPTKAALIDEYRNAIKNIVYSKAYDVNKNFTVKMHRFLNKFKAPLNSDGVADVRYFAADCFNLGMRGQFEFGVALWNSLLMPPCMQSKAIDFRDFPRCPVTEYIPTQISYACTGLDGINMVDLITTTPKPTTTNGGINLRTSQYVFIVWQSLLLLLFSQFSS